MYEDALLSCNEQIKCFGVRDLSTNISWGDIITVEQQEVTAKKMHLHVPGDESRRAVPVEHVHRKDMHEIQRPEQIGLEPGQGPTRLAGVWV